MLCVSIGRGRHRHVVAEHRHLFEQGARLVEFRIDYIDGEVNLRRLIEDRPCPVIITCRREQDGGKWTRGEEARRLLLRTAIAEGVEYVDLEDDVAAEIPRFGKTQRIVSMHDFRKTPDDLPAIHARLKTLDADIVKMATLANHPHDNVRMVRLVREANAAGAATIGVCMGDIGTPTRILAGKYGAPFTFSTFHHERTLAPGQLSFQQMRDIYHYDEIRADTEVYGVIGDPIAQSMSPLIHNAAFHSLGLNKVYVPFRVPRQDVLGFLDTARELGIRGLSVTIPHKEAVLRKITRADGAVQDVGAANTLVFEPDHVVGHNTDYRAAMDALEEAMKAKHGPTPLEGKNVLLLGAGGAARAIACGLKRRGAKLVITSRTIERSQALAELLGARAVDWAARYHYEPEVLVNCTPVGMHPHVDEIPYDRHHLKPSMVVFDTVYNPENTLLIKEARVRQCTVVSGVEMFIRQACLQFELFTDRDAPADLMRDTLRRAIGAAKY